MHRPRLSRPPFPPPRSLGRGLAQSSAGAAFGSTRLAARPRRLARGRRGRRRRVGRAHPLRRADRSGGDRDAVRRPDRRPVPSSRFDPATGGVRAQGPPARRDQAFQRPDAAPNRRRSRAALLEAVHQHGLSLLPWSARAIAPCPRRLCPHARCRDNQPHRRISDRTGSTIGCHPCSSGKRRLDAIEPSALVAASKAFSVMSGPPASTISLRPHFVSPAGSRHAIDYAAEAGPTVEVRAQALFSLADIRWLPRRAAGPRLTSPAGRPIQTTRDLPGFWAAAGRRSPRKCAAATPASLARRSAAAAPTLKTRAPTSPALTASRISESASPIRQVRSADQCEGELLH